jgi:hypothetical protein
MNRRAFRLTVRHGLRRLYRWRRAAALSVIALVSWMARARGAAAASAPRPMPLRPQRPGVAVRPGQ